MSNAERAIWVFGCFWSSFCKVGGSFAAFFCDYDPAVKQVIFSKFIVRHRGRQYTLVG